MGKKYIIELCDDCPNEFKGIIVFGLTPDGRISIEPITVEDLTPYTEPDMEQIQVGDEVIPRETEYDTMIVTRLWKDDYDSDCIDAIGFDGRISSFLVSRVSKTGKHYEIAAVLQKMKES